MIVYFDTSAVVKLLIEDDAAALARRAWAAADEVVFSFSLSLRLEPPCRPRRASAGLTWDALHVAKSELAWRLARGARIEVSSAICAHAGDLAEQHALRGYDAAHLASAIAAGPELLLASWDRDLRTAAQAEGIGLIPGALD